MPGLGCNNYIPSQVYRFIELMLFRKDKVYCYLITSRLQILCLKYDALPIILVSMLQVKARRREWSS